MEISLKNLFDWIMKSIVFVLVITLVFCSGAFVLTKYFMQPTYTTSVKFYASGSENSLQALQSAQSVAPQYIEFLNVNEFYESVSQDLKADVGVELSPKEIAATVGFSAVIQETSSFFVSVSTADANLSYNIALSIAEMAPLQIQNFQNVGALEVLSNPVMPTAPSSPNVLTNTFIGLFLGFVLASAIVVLREVLDNRIKTADEITALFGLPVFGVVPDFSAGEKKGAQK